MRDSPENASAGAWQQGLPVPGASDSRRRDRSRAQSLRPATDEWSGVQDGRGAFCTASVRRPAPWADVLPDCGPIQAVSGAGMPSSSSTCSAISREVLLSGPRQRRRNFIHQEELAGRHRVGRREDAVLVDGHQGVDGAVGAGGRPQVGGPLRRQGPGLRKAVQVAFDCTDILVRVAKRQQHQVGHRGQLFVDVRAVSATVDDADPAGRWCAGAPRRWQADPGSGHRRAGRFG